MARYGPAVKRRAGALGVGVAASILLTAGLAAADLCHTPLAGTRSFALSADVTSYRFATGGRLLVDWTRSARCAGTAVWDYASRVRTGGALSCQRSAPRDAAAADNKLVATDATRVVRVIPAPNSVDAPNRLAVYDRATNRPVASWPLFERPARVALYGGIALLSGADRHELYALRISDGRMAELGIARARDRPLIGPAGIVYQDDLDLAKHRTAPAERTLKLVPLSTVRQELNRSVFDRPFIHVVLACTCDPSRGSHPAFQGGATASRCTAARSLP